MAGRVRVFELAKRLGIESADLMALLQELDISVTSPMAELEPGVDKLVQKKLGGQRATSRRVHAAAVAVHDAAPEGERRGKIKRKARKVVVPPPDLIPDVVPAGVSTVIPRRMPETPQQETTPLQTAASVAELEAPETALPFQPTIGPMPPGETYPAAPIPSAPTVAAPSTVTTSRTAPPAPTVATVAMPTAPPAAPEPVAPAAPEPVAAGTEAAVAPLPAAPPETPPAEPGTAEPAAPEAPAAPAPLLLDPAILARVESTQRQKRKQTNLRDKVKQKLKESKERPAAETLLPATTTEPSERQQRRKERGTKERVIEVPEVVTVDELAKAMTVKANEVILALMKDGIMATKNQRLDMEMIELVADKFDCNVRIGTSELDIEEDLAETNPEDLVPRAPVVTVMGHVDHGKTSLLDYVRNAQVAEGEAGGITQHIGAYDVTTPTGRVVFLDTPGHEAFTAMRAHGAKVTDVVVLVVAADDGVMPQTLEAIHHAREANVPLLVAINKIDRPDADPDRVKRELADHNVLVEGWGGEVQCINVSAKTGEGIDTLLEQLSMESQLLELKANPKREARGVIIEARLDRGRGAVASLLVQHGTLKTGDIFVAGMQYGKVRGMHDDRGNKLKEAGPAVPVEILGFNGVPQAGDTFVVLEDDRKARQIADSRAHRQRALDMPTQARVTLDALHQFIAEGEMQDLKVIIKADVHGSAQALQESLEKLSTDEVRLICIHSAVGGITESDVMLARASNAFIIGFNVRPEPKARKLSDSQKIDIRLYRVIYDAIDDVRAAMSGLLAPESRETITGRAEVRDTFRISGVGAVAGCMVLSGELARTNKVRVVRDSVVIKEGDISSLRRFKDDVKSVQAGLECGLAVENFGDIKNGDILETYTVEAIERTL